MPFESAFSGLFAQDTMIAWGVLGAVLLALIGSIFYSWYRGKMRQGPSKRAEANKVEVTYMAALVGMAIFLVISSLTANAKDYPSDPPKPAATVSVIGYQWCWRFHYQGTSVTATGQCQRFRNLPVLVVPVGEPVRLDVTSLDVVHAVWVPKWKFKLYAYPDHVGSLTINIPQAGKWIGRCANICGLYHYEMDFWLQAVPPATFNSYLRTGRL